jgi:anti-sigma regulatory factor (Ser/Thr protein kinase)
MAVRRLQWTAAAVPDEVGPLRRAVVAAAADLGLDGDRSERLQLAISEALSNVVLHAYADASGDMRVALERDDLEVRVTISDDGTGLGRQTATPGLGLGLGIIATAADRVEVASKPARGTRMTIAFDLEDGFAAPGGE